MTGTGRIVRGQRVRVERRPMARLVAHARSGSVHSSGPWPEVWEGTVLRAAYQDGALTEVEIYGKRESTGESRRATFSVARNAFFRTRVTPLRSP
ncbi:hypothetical protein GCM10010278_83700 [Streptomyces melanogenes]|nr:hypothetical protein GCM10010278_83700 [Streptomyces melanogenes]